MFLRAGRIMDIAVGYTVALNGRPVAALIAGRIRGGTPMAMPVWIVVAAIPVAVSLDRPCYPARLAAPSADA
jgi:hypothetical protein